MASDTGRQRRGQEKGEENEYDRCLCDMGEFFFTCCVACKCVVHLSMRRRSIIFGRKKRESSVSTTNKLDEMRQK